MFNFENKNHRIKQQINRHLTEIGKKLKLPVPLNLAKARDCYASTLMRIGESRDDIGQMLGPSNSAVTEHYLPSINTERISKIISSYCNEQCVICSTFFESYKTRQVLYENGVF